MKAKFSIVAMALLLAGCAQPSRFQHDPRAAVVGPAYLDYIQEYPRDRATQYYYPSFGISGFAGQKDLLAGMPSATPADIRKLETVIPPMTPEARQTEGKGWPELEHKGIPVFLR